MTVGFKWIPNYHACILVERIVYAVVRLKLFHLNAIINEKGNFLL